MNAVATRTPTVTPEDLLARPDEKDYELVDGQLMERPMSSLSSWVGGQLFRRLDDFVMGNALGFVWPDGNGFRCFPDDPGRVRKPDVSFIGRDRFSVDQLAEGYVPVAPDLVAEVISPNDLATDLEAKVREYLTAGVRLVWVIDPLARTARVHRPDGSAAWLREGDDLSGEDVVPGFRCPLGALFPPAPTIAPAPAAPAP